MDLDRKHVETRAHDDLTKPTTFDSKVRNSATDRETREGRIAAVLRTYCTPTLRYDGISAYEIARKVLAVIDEPNGNVVEPKPDALRDIRDHSA
jgi:hypothetical protein